MTAAAPPPSSADRDERHARRARRDARIRRDRRGAAPRHGHRQPPRLPRPTGCSPRSSSAAPTRCGGRSSVGSGTNATRGETLPLLPGGNFLTNAAKVLDAIPFWLALGNSIIVSSVITVSVVTFSTLAGYAFAKLRFRGTRRPARLRHRDARHPDAARHHPAVHGDAPARLDGHARRGHRADARHRVRRVLHAPVPGRRHPRRAHRGGPRRRSHQIRTFCTVGVPAARPAMAILGLFTFMMAWTDYLWPLIVLDPRTRRCRTRSQPAAVGLLRRLLDRAHRRGARHHPAARALRHRGQAARPGIMQGAVKG